MTESEQLLQEDRPEHEEQTRTSGSRLSDFRERITRALQSFDRGPIDQFGSEPGASELRGEGVVEPGLDVDQHDVLAEVTAPSRDSRFPIGPLGYSRAAVDERIAELERELEQLRASEPPISIADEIERLGEHTASILVVAHDQARETTRLAQEQADRCIADAASNAVAMTETAKRKLIELDNETDAVWRERTRLLDDARSVGLALIALADEAADRFPAEAADRFPAEAADRFPAEVKVTDARIPVD